MGLYRSLRRWWGSSDSHTPVVRFRPRTGNWDGLQPGVRTGRTSKSGRRRLGLWHRSQKVENPQVGRTRISRVDLDRGSGMGRRVDWPPVPPRSYPPSTFDYEENT